MTAPKSEVRVYSIEQIGIEDSCTGELLKNVVSEFDYDELKSKYEMKTVAFDVSIERLDKIKSSHDQEVQALKEESANKDKRIAELEDHKRMLMLAIKKRDKDIVRYSEMSGESIELSERIEQLENALKEVKEKSDTVLNPAMTRDTFMMKTALENCYQLSVQALSRKEV